MWKAKRTRVRRTSRPSERRSRYRSTQPARLVEDRAGQVLLDCLHRRRHRRAAAGLLLPSGENQRLSAQLAVPCAYVWQPWRCAATVTAFSSNTTPKTPRPPSSSAPRAGLNIESNLAYSPQAKDHSSELSRPCMTVWPRPCGWSRSQPSRRPTPALPEWLPTAPTRIVPMRAAPRSWRACAHHYRRVLFKTLTCQFMGKLLVVVSRPD